MEILKHPSCTKELGAPPDMPEPDCEALPVVERTNQFGTWSVSFWRPSSEELKTLVDGGCLELWVRATDEAHPVVGLGVEAVERIEVKSQD